MSTMSIPTPEAPVQIRTLGKRWFWIDNAVYDRYARQLGIDGLGLYGAFARYANNQTAQCWPSLSRLATEMGTDLKRVAAAMERLEATGLIVLSHHPGKGTVITLVDPTLAVPLPSPPDSPPPVVAFSSTRAPEEKEQNPEENTLESCSSSSQEKGGEENSGVVSLVASRKPAPASDGTPSWHQGGIVLPPQQRPDEVLATLGLVPGEANYQGLLATAEAELQREGHNPLYVILPMKHSRMIDMLLREGLLPDPAPSFTAQEPL